jgi:plasmid stability protein
MQSSIAIIDCMAGITIRQLSEHTKRKLRIRADQHGRSMEQEAREILQAELAKNPAPPRDMVKGVVSETMKPTPSAHASL